MSGHWTDNNYVSALVWLGIVVPLGVVLFDLAAGRWTETTSLLLFLGAVNAAAWTGGHRGDRGSAHLPRHHHG